MDQNNLTQYVVTRRGIVDINDITISDEVYTAKRRWRKVLEIKEEVAIEVIKTDHSFYALLSGNQELALINKKDIPFFVPRDKNLDSKTLKYWFEIGSNLSKNEKFLFNELFHIPINVILMKKEKCRAFIDGFFSNNLNIRKLNKKVKLAILFMMKKFEKNHDYRSTYIAKKTHYQKLNTQQKIKTLVIDEDNSYCVNGLYILNRD